MAIPDSPETLIPAAVAAINTRQPRLALLYMEKASRQLEERRRARLTPLQQAFEDLGKVLEGLVSPFVEAGKNLEKIFRASA